MSILSIPEVQMIDAATLREVAKRNRHIQAAVHASLLHLHEAACHGMTLASLAPPVETAGAVKGHLENLGFDVKRAGHDFPHDDGTLPLLVSF